MIVWGPLFSPLQFDIPLDMLSRAFASWPCLFGPRFCQFWLQSFCQSHSLTHITLIFLFKLFYWNKFRIMYELISLNKNIKVIWVSECDWQKDWSQNWQNLGPKRQGQLANALESISKGISNCNGLNRGPQTINYNI